jgi:hypothetical protein
VDRLTPGWLPATVAEVERAAESGLLDEELHHAVKLAISSVERALTPG